jgi:hypothetical protein
MNPAINFVELENRVISATYRNLMIKGEGRTRQQDQRGAIARPGHHDCLSGA